MSPSTIAIIPLVLAMAGGWAAWFSVLRREESGDRVVFATIFTGVCGFVLVGASYLVGVVVFNDWEFLA